MSSQRQNDQEKSFFSYKIDGKSCTSRRSSYVKRGLKGPVFKWTFLPEITARKHRMDKGTKRKVLITNNHHVELRMGNCIAKKFNKITSTGSNGRISCKDNDTDPISPDDKMNMTVCQKMETLETHLSEDKLFHSLELGKYGVRRESIERTANENWILLQDNEAMRRRHEKQWRNLCVSVNEQVVQTNEMLSRRVTEVKTMSKNRREAVSILPELNERQLQLVEELTEKNSVDFMAERRKRWTVLDHFRHAGRMVLIMVRGFNDMRRRYHHVDAFGKQPVKAASGIFVDIEHEKKAHIVPGMAPSLYMAFINQPENKTPEEINQILWVVRASRAFRNLFPDDMEYELAKVVSYERYDNGRVVAYQDRKPDRFYYIISGKLSMLMEYQLNTGTVIRVVGEKKKGDHTNVEELENQWNREHHLVAKGGVELLSIEKEDFFYLTKVNEGLPLDFLQTVDIFKEFPIERFEQEPDAIQYKYYGKGQIIAEDGNRTPWIQVIKTGKLKVVRQQSILDIPCCKSYIKDAKKRPADPLGTLMERTTHADAMLGLLSYQRRVKKMLRGEQPYGNARSSLVSREASKHEKETASKLAADTQNNQYSDKEKRKSIKVPVFGTIPKSPELRSRPITPEPESVIEERQRNKYSLPVVINVPTKLLSETKKPVEKSWLEQETQIPELPKLVCSTVTSSKQLPEKFSNVQLDILKARDVFGWTEKDMQAWLGVDHLHEAKFSEAKGVTLVSDGAEIIAISKRFFLENANNNTMLKVETMSKEYMSTHDAKEVLYRNANWDQYKTNTLKNTVHSLTRTSL